MRNSITRIIAIPLFALLCAHSHAQFQFTGQFRPRIEVRDGYKTIISNNSIPSIHVDQRTRLKLNYFHKSTSFQISIQDVRVWGSTSQLNTTDNGISVHEAWCSINLKKHQLIKIGRQEIVYDDARIFGNVDWTQQGRKHDALLYKLDRKIDLDFGIAYNSTSASLTNTGYQTPNNYKMLSYIRANLKKELKTDLSLYFIGIGNESESNYRTLNFEFTSGSYLKQALSENIAIIAEGFYQFGETPQKEIKSAFLGSLKLNHKLTRKVHYSLGVDVLSGSSSGNSSKAFDPLFGTHHKFYGLMDYFYVGNGHGNVGLNDLYMSLNFALAKHSISLMGHYFSSQARLPNKEHYLGYESDLVFKFKVNDYCSAKAGYSLMIADENMRLIKSGDQLINHWGWLILDVNVDFLEKITNK